MSGRKRRWLPLAGLRGSENVSFYSISRNGMPFRLFCFRKELSVVRWKRVDGGAGDGKSTEGTSLRFWICSGLFPRDALLRRATLWLYSGTALPFFEGRGTSLAKGEAPCLRAKRTGSGRSTLPGERKSPPGLDRWRAWGIGGSDAYLTMVSSSRPASMNWPPLVCFTWMAKMLPLGLRSDAASAGRSIRE